VAVISLCLLSHSALPFDRIGVRREISQINDSLVACVPIADIVYAVILIDALKLIGCSYYGAGVIYTVGFPGGRVKHDSRAIRNMFLP
jgi:hypothetical protein